MDIFVGCSGIANKAPVWRAYLDAALAAFNKLAKALLVGAATTAPCHAATVPRYHTESICQILKDVSKFDGQHIELHSEVMFTMHGRHLFGGECSELGSLALSVSDDQFNDTSVTKFVRKVMSQKGKASVILLGLVVSKQRENYKGEFVLERVVAVSSRTR